MNKGYILCVNAGSSSYKFKLYNNDILEFQCELKNHSFDEYSSESSAKDKPQSKSISQSEFEKPLELIISLVQENLQIDLGQALTTAIFRIVHGGEKYTKPIVIDKDQLDIIRKLGQMAPLHSPETISAIEQSIQLFPKAKIYGVFDTSFHLTNPKENYLYALPYGYYENLGIRKFGFHGIAYANVLRKIGVVAEFSDNPSFGKACPDNSGVARYKPEKQPKNKSDQKVLNAYFTKIISCHLGSGSSVCAIKDGVSLNHSFGFTPDENLIMATRSGEVDYDAIAFLKDKLLLSDQDVTKLLNLESGLLGVSGYSKDMKILVEDYSRNERSKLAVDMYVNKVVEYVSTFYIELQGTDAIIFSGGIGFASWVIREMVLKKLEILGIRFDQEINKNEFSEDVNFIESIGSICKIAVVKVDEELEMVWQVQEFYC